MGSLLEDGVRDKVDRPAAGFAGSGRQLPETDGKARTHSQVTSGSKVARGDDHILVEESTIYVV